MIKEAITRMLLTILGKIDVEEFSEWIESVEIEEDVKSHLVLCSRMIRQRNKKDVIEMLELILNGFEANEGE